MKRTAASILLLAGIGGCVSPDGKQAGLKVKGFNEAYKAATVPGVVGPTGEPVMVTEAAKKATADAQKAAKAGAKKAAAKVDSAVQQASAKAVEKVQTVVNPVSAAMPVEDPGVTQAAGIVRVRGSECSDCNSHVPGLGMKLAGGHGNHDPYAYGPNSGGLMTALGRGGILPVPGMGPPGAVAAVGAIGAGGPIGPVATNMRTSVKFLSPANMKVTWLGQTGYVEPGLSAPANYNFLQGNVYRLRLSGIARQPGRTYYPSLEIAPASYKTLTFLSHNTVPVGFTDDDLERVNAGSMVVKVIYLPDPAFQDAAAVAGAEELVSTQLAPGVDPIVEATSRGTILAVVRIGNIDLENPNTPAMSDVPGMGAPGMMAPPAGPGMMAPPGAMPMMAPPGGAPVMPPPQPAVGGIKAPAVPVPNVPKMPAALPPVKATPTSVTK